MRKRKTEKKFQFPEKVFGKVEDAGTDDENIVYSADLEYVIYEDNGPFEELAIYELVGTRKVRRVVEERIEEE